MYFNGHDIPKCRRKRTDRPKAAKLGNVVLLLYETPHTTVAEVQTLQPALQQSDASYVYKTKVVGGGVEIYLDTCSKPLPSGHSVLRPFLLPPKKHLDFTNLSHAYSFSIFSTP